ncbi:MAG: thioredoxin family protein [Bacteroidota bacterium]|nr:thioredoxin family protein [Bacteroidota bacterium]
MYQFIFALIIGFLPASSSFNARPTPASAIQWMSLADARKALETQKKPLLIDLYTDWCGWCKVMDKKTYSNPKVIAYIQEHFYPVKLNAETRETLNWNDKTYRYNTGIKANDFAVFLTYGQLSFPTTVFIPTDGSGPQPVPGYLSPKDLEPIVRYFGDGRFGKQRFEDYQRSFQPEW